MTSDAMPATLNRHHPELYHARQLGAWVWCCCGWRSRWSYTTVTGAHLAFGEHLLEAARG